MKSLAIGAVLWDLINGEEYIGGAPFNLAAHLAGLGWCSALLSGVGQDERGRRALREMQRLSVDSRFVHVHPLLPTGISHVELDAAGSPSYELPIAAYDEIPWPPGSFEKVQAFAPDILCVGTHEQRSENTRHIIGALCGQLPVRYVYYDVNLRLDFAPRAIIEDTVAKADILKLNDQEAVRLASMFWGAEMGPEEFCRRIAAEFELDCVVVTLGSNGCLLQRRGQIYRIPGQRVQVANTVGCGDAFSAGFLTTLLKTGDALAAAQSGNKLGAYVASFSQAVPHYTAAVYDIFGKGGNVPCTG